MLDIPIAYPKLYFRELKIITKNTNSAIIWRQLEYWFWKTNYTPFWKTIDTPKDNNSYNQDTSWWGELALSNDEFKTGFKKIGTWGGSFKQMEDYENQEGTMSSFKGMMYKAVVNKITKKTFYYRDNELVSSVIQDNDLEACFDFDKELFKEKSKREIPRMEDCQLGG